MNTKERLKLFVKSLKMGQNVFEKEVGIANGYLASKSLTISSDTVERIIKKYPNLNLEWLFCGEGEMLKSGIVVMTDGMNFYKELYDNATLEINKLNREMGALENEIVTLKKQISHKEWKDNIKPTGTSE